MLTREAATTGRGGESMHAEQRLGPKTKEDTMMHQACEEKFNALLSVCNRLVLEPLVDVLQCATCMHAECGRIQTGDGGCYKRHHGSLALCNRIGVTQLGQ